MVKKSTFKDFLGYNDDDAIRRLCITLPQLTGYVKHFANNKIMSLNVNDNKLLKKYTKIWEKVSILMNVKFDSEPVYGDNDKYINFQGKKIPEENASYKCSSLVMLDFVIRVSKRFYPQTLLEECKDEIKKTKVENLINDNLDLSSSDDETDNLIMRLSLIMLNNLLKFKTVL